MDNSKKKKKTANPFQNEEIQKVLVGLSVSRTENIFEFIVISFKDMEYLDVSLVLLIFATLRLVK